MSLIPVVVLVALLASSVALFGDGSSGGANQIALMLAAGVAILIGIGHGHTWESIEKGIVHGISLALGAVIILLTVGALIGSWILAGIVPTMIYYGLMLLSPSVFLPTACLLCCLVSLATGSSWTTAGTVGVALVGIAVAQGISPGLAAGAIISGAYFGDKMSPLSDTTNLAPAMAGTDLFTHIRHMVWTTTPSLVLALLIYVVLGLSVTPPRDTTQVNAILAALGGAFAIGPHLLLPVALVLVLVVKKMPAFPALLDRIARGVPVRRGVPAAGHAGLRGLARPAGMGRPGQGRVDLALRRLQARVGQRRARRPAVARRHGQHALHGVAHHDGHDVRRRHGGHRHAAAGGGQHPQPGPRHGQPDCRDPRPRRWA